MKTIKNLLGRLQGCSHCVVCGDYYNWKMPHLIPLRTHNLYAIPFCFECYIKYSKHELVDFLDAHWMNNPKDREYCIEVRESIWQELMEVE